MASEIIVNTIKAPTTGANANKVIIPTGVTLDIADNLAYDSMPSGTVIQQVSNHTPSMFSTSGTTYVSTNASVTITPRYANSKMVIWICGSAHFDGASDHGRGQIRKNGAAFSNFNNDDLLAYIGRTEARGDMVGMSYVDDNVGTTSSVTYAYYIKSSSSRTTYFYRNTGIIVQEIKV